MVIVHYQRDMSTTSATVVMRYWSSETNDIETQRHLQLLLWDIGLQKQATSRHSDICNCCYVILVSETNDIETQRHLQLLLCDIGLQKQATSRHSAVFCAMV